MNVLTLLHQFQHFPQVYCVRDTTDRTERHVDVRDEEQLQQLAERLYQGVWVVEPRFDLHRFELPYEDYHALLDTLIGEHIAADQLVLTADEVWTRWCREHPTSRLTMETHLKWLEVRMGNDYRCDHPPLAWFCRPLHHYQPPWVVPASLYPFITPLTFVDVFTTFEGSLQTIEEYDREKDRIELMIHGECANKILTTHMQYINLVDGMEGYYQPQHPDRFTYLPMEGNDALLYTSRPTHKEAPALIEWMSTHACWAYVVVAVDELDVVTRAGLYEEQELDFRKYQTHYLWNTQWWELGPWVPTTPDSRACLVECLVKGIVRIIHVKH